MGDRHFGVRFGGYDRDSALICDGLANGGAAIGFVCDDGHRRRFPPQKCVKGFAIVGLRASDVDPQRPPQPVYSGVNLTAATTA